MKFEIKNRWTGSVLFVAEIEANDDIPFSIKVGLAVLKAVDEGADLEGADLIGADLKGADLEGAYLEGANLKGAYLRGANLKGAYLRGADLKDANLKGAYLEGADLEGANLRGANLIGAYLEGADLKGANLKGANLIGAYLKGANLRGANLIGADLKGAYLRGAYLRGADLRGADLKGVKFGDDVPVIPNIHQAVYKAASAPNALDMSSWHHSCGTTHCRAGWVVTLAGEAGKNLETILGTPVAAALIYAKSDPSLTRVPDFYASNQIALDNMRELAKKEGLEE